jgi:hypothetical protein
LKIKPQLIALALALLGVMAMPSFALAAPTVTATKEATTASGPGGSTQPGGQIDYKITIQNTSGAETANGVSLTDAAPAHTSDVGTYKVSPLAFPDAYNAVKNTLLQISATGVLANDKGFPAPSAVPIAGGATAQGGTVTLNADGSFDYNPPNNFTGTDTFTYTVTNTQLPNDTATVTLTVQQPPAFTSADNATFQTLIAGTVFNVTTSGSPTVTTIGRTGTLPSGVNFTDNGNGTAKFDGTPAAGTGGTYTQTLTASNGVAPNAVQTFTLTVNQPPVITSANNKTFTAGVAGTTFQLTASGYPTTFTFTNTGAALPGGLSLSSSGLLSGTPDAGTGGTYNLTFQVANGVSPAGTQSFTLTVNEAPTIASFVCGSGTNCSGSDSITFQASVAGTVTFTATGFPSGGSIVLSKTGTLPSGLTFTNNGDGTAKIAGTPAVGSGGIYSPITITANNGVSPNGTRDFILTVTEAPTAVNDPTGGIPSNSSPAVNTYHIPLNGSLGVGSGLNVLTNDTLGEPDATVTSFGKTTGLETTVASNTTGTTVANGTVQVFANGTFTYTPPSATFTGLDSFKYTITNTTASSTATVSLAVGIRPAANNETYPTTILRNVGINTATSTNFSVLTNDTGDQRVAAFVSATNGSGTVATDGKFTFISSTTVAGGTNGTIVYSVSNGFGSVNGTVTIPLGTGRIWFIDQNAASNGNGQFGTPFKNLTNFVSANPDAASDNIFLYGSGTAYTGPVTLKASEKLVGGGASATLAAITGLTFPADSGPAPATGGARPTIDTSGITLNTGNTIRGLDVGSTGANTKLVGSGFGTLVIGNTTTADVALSGTGKAMDLATGTFDSTSAFVSVATTSSASHGLKIGPAVAGTVAFGSTSVSGSATQGIYVTQSTANINFGTTIIGATTAGEGLRLETNSAGTRTFAALSITNSSAQGIVHTENGGANGGGLTTVTGLTTITNPAGVGILIQKASASNGVTFANVNVTQSGGTGVVLQNNAGAVTFADLDISPDANQRGLQVSNTVTGATGTITTTTGSTISTTGANAVEVVGFSTPSFRQQLAMVFDSVSSTGGVNNILLTNVSGSLVMNAGALSGATGASFNVNGSNATVTYAGSITQATASQRVVDIQDNTGGTINLSGSVTSTTGPGTGVFLDSNTGATINFTGGINLSTGANAAFTATAGGTVNVCDESPCNPAATGGLVNSITTTTGTAVDVENTTIGANKLEFKSISAGTGASGPANGIILNSTGSSGGLIVKGDGNTSVGGNSSGGVIQHTTTYGITMTNTNSPSFTNMNIHDIGRNGIDGGTGIVNFTLANSTITNTGTAGVGQYEDNGVAILDHVTPFDTNTISGVVSITGNTITQPRRIGIALETWSGGITNLTITNNTISGGTTTSNISHGIEVLTQGTAGTNASLTQATIQSNTISGFRFFDVPNSFYIGGSGIFLSGGNTGNTNAETFGAQATPILIDKNSISNMGDSFIKFTFNGRAGVSFVNITNNGAATSPTGLAMTNCEGVGLSVFMGGGADVSHTFTGTATVDNNRLDLNNRAGSSGLGVQMDNGGNVADIPQVKFTVSNNTISNEAGSGIAVIAINNNGSLNTNVVNNNVTEAPTVANQYGIRISQNSAGPSICAKISGNTSFGNGGAPGIGYRRNTGNVFSIDGMAATASPGVDQYISGQNPNSQLASGIFQNPADSQYYRAYPISQTSGFTNCTSSAPLLLASGGVDASAVLPKGALLGQAALDATVAAAVQRWEAAGLTKEQVATLRSLSFEVADLPDLRLGEADGNRIRISRNAGGNGWFISADKENKQFSKSVSATRSYTEPASAPAGRIDLLTAITHEMGHALGLPDSYDAKDRDKVMYGFLTNGERRVPAIGDAMAAKPGAHAGPQYLNSGLAVNIGDIPPGKTVVVTFSVQVENPLVPANTTQISNQGTVSGTNFATVNGVSTANPNTDDPNVGGTADPTITLLCANPATVTTNADAGAGSLRQALIDVCDGGTINFAPALNGQTITLASELVVDKNVTINGPGADVLTIGGNNTFRLVNVTLPAAGTATIQGLSFTGGRANPSGAGTNGGAIEFNNVGTLNLNNCEFFANSMAAANGDVIFSNAAAKLNINGCTFRNNTTEIAIHLGSTPATIVNSTISNNTGLAMRVDGGPAVGVTNCTIANNGAGGVSLSPGGGGTVTLTNTILSQNNGNDLTRTNADCSGNQKFNSGGHNLIDDATSSKLCNSPQPGDKLGTGFDPLLGALANNGGPTKTRLPAPASPALDAGDDCVTNNSCAQPLPAALTTDQRGYNRSVDSGDAGVVATVDIGAIEANYVITATAGTPQSAVVGTTFATNLQATVTESTVPVSGVLVTFTPPGSGASGTFSPGNTATTNASGVATADPFTANSTAGSYNVTAAGADIPGSATYALTNTGGPATQFLVTAPANATAGTAFNITVTAKDGSGNTDVNYTGTVTFTRSDNAAGSASPGNYTFVAGDNGVHTFTNGVTFVTAGNQTVTATDGAKTGTSNNVLVGAAGADHFSVVAPGGATAGSAFNFSVTALDPFSNIATGYTGTVHFTSSDGAANLPSDYTFVGGDNGAHTFSAILNTAGNQTITATQGAVTGTSNTIAVVAGSATHFLLTTPASATAGSAFTFSVTALDGANNIATGYTGTVHFTKSDSGAGSAVPPDYTFVGGDNGAHTFTNGATFVTAGNQTITATQGAVTGTSNNVAVSAANADHFSVVAPGSATAGNTFTFSVTALDQFNNTATGYTGTVHFTKSDAGAGSAVPPDYTFLAGDNGAHSFTNGGKFVTVGNQTITATDGGKTGTSNNVAVSAAAANHFSVVAPGSASAGTSFNFSVTALDQFNNTDTGYTGTAHFTSSDGAANLPVDYTFVAGDNGAHTFSAKLNTAGNQTITATQGAVTGTSNTVTVGAGSATHFSVTAPANATAGSAFNFAVTALDQFNNTATGYAGTVHFSSSDGAGTVPVDSTLSSGTGIFSANLRTAGNQTITAKDTANASIAGTSNNVAVSATTADHFSVVAPSSATAGSTFTFSVTALDPFSNTATGYTGTVHFTKSDSGAGSAVPPDYTFVAGDNGVRTFTNGAIFVTVGNQTVTATDGAKTGTSNNVLVSAANANHFSVVAPGGTTAGSAFNFSVTALDQFNNTATGYAGTVHFTSTDGAAILPADTTLTNGAGTFNANLKTAGGQTITAKDTVNASIAGTSNTITVSAGAANHFTVTAPASATAGSAFNFSVTAQDQFNNTATGYAGTVHFTSTDGVAALPVDSTLAGGTGTFSAILKTAGAQTITAKDTANASIAGTSNTINVSAAGATHFAVSAPANVPLNSPFNFTVTALDQFNNTATGYAGTVHFTSTDAAAVLPSDSTLTSGAGTFSATLKTPGPQTITAKDTVNASITGTSNTILAGKVTPTITTTASGTINLGGNVSDSAALAGGFSPTGSITFKLYGPNDATCGNAPVFTSAAIPVSGNATYNSGNFTPTLAGTYRWIASYSGDTNNNAVAGACNDANESVVVNKGNPAISGTVSPATGNIGTPFTDTATLSSGSSPTGTITFTVHGPNTDNCASPIFTSTKTVAGNANYTSDAFTATQPGTYKFLAVYSGDANNNSVATVCGVASQTFTVNAPPPTPTPTPTATPAKALNISTRMRTELGDKAMIGGFIITGNASKSLVLRGIGPSLSAFNLSDLLLDPELELRGSSNNLIFKNKDWKDDQRPLIEGTNFQPKDDRESVIVITLNAGAYTALLTGKNGTEGVGLVEIYDTNEAAGSELANISTRGMVRTDDKVMIGGFTLGGPNNATRIAVRGRGPSLSQFNLSPLLANPVLELRNENGTIMVVNDDWTDDPVSAANLTANGLGLTDPKESGIFISLTPPGQFTAILSGKNGGIGIGLIEIYNLK